MMIKMGTLAPLSSMPQMCPPSIHSTLSRSYLALLPAIEPQSQPLQPSDAEGVPGGKLRPVALLKSVDAYTSALRTCRPQRHLLESGGWLGGVLDRCPKSCVQTATSIVVLVILLPRRLGFRVYILYIINHTLHIS
jgi:hypothetical protein